MVKLTEPSLLVTYEVGATARDIIATTVGTSGKVAYLADCAEGERAGALAGASVLLSRNTAAELREGEAGLLQNARLIQFVSAGIDFIPLGGFAPDIAIACNGGGYAEPMAEHAVMMALAAFKRLFIEHRKLEVGEFDQFRANRMLAGSVCGILGFGGIGKATGGLMRGLGTKVHAVNRSGTTDEPVDWIGTDQELEHLLRTSDILVLSLPLTPATTGLLGKRELELMKPDAVLVNLARGEIIEEAALFDHLRDNPGFTACIDAWWIEPVRHGRFETGHDFMKLPNVIASPHNSASVSGWRGVALKRAVENASRGLRGETPAYLVPEADRMM